MSKTDPVLSTLAKHGPLSTFELREKLWQNFQLGIGAISKRLERLYEKGKVHRYLRLEHGAYLYYIPELHSESLLQKCARKCVPLHSKRLGRILNALSVGKVLSIFELGRLVNIKFFSDHRIINPIIKDIIERVKKLGIRVENKFLVSPFLPEESIHKNIDRYKATFHDEAYFLSFTKDLFMAKQKAEVMTLFRRPDLSSLVNFKFDMFGEGGWKKPVKVIIECNLRRKTTTADLIGFDQRVGGTMKKSLGSRSPYPIARYYIAEQFDSNEDRDKDALSFAINHGIRCLHATDILSRKIREINPYEKFPAKKFPWGKFNELRGKGFEGEVEPGYKYEGFNTRRNKLFYLDGYQVTDKITREMRKRAVKVLTDIDVYAHRISEIDPDINEILLIECKSSRLKLQRKALFSKMKRYFGVAKFLEKKSENNKVKIIVIANIDELDKEEIMFKAQAQKIRIDFITPKKFYYEKRRFLKGATKWLFGIED